MLLVSAADEYMGFCITSHLLQLGKLSKYMRILCKTNTKRSILKHQFKEKRMEIWPVDHDDTNQLSLAMRNVDVLVMAIGNESKRVEECLQLSQVATQSGVRSIVLVSHIGASQSCRALDDYAKIEADMIKQCIDTETSYVILKLDMIQQYFHLLSVQIEATKSIRLPLKPSASICPISIHDVCHTIESLITDQQGELMNEILPEHKGQLYCLTGPSAINSEDVLTYLTESTGYQEYTNMLIRPMEMRYYLQNLHHDVWFDARIKAEKANTPEYGSIVYDAPTDTFINSHVDYFEWVNSTNGSFVTPHVEFITSRTPMSLRTFFHTYANEFKPRV
ncbi:hypothetical protein BDB01DRAFT_814718 [Pilobolus umbonatus]|nr:hypothetical protein BDB01DRAFT_814718 [Pilobolus umbonatus]